MILPETINEVRDKVRIFDIISQKVKLKPSTNGFIGLCPFHGEKTPSFHVKDADGFYHCFGCGESGDSITFVMKSENYSFPDAIIYLCSQLGIEPKYSNKIKINTNNNLNVKKDVFNTNELANNYFKENLKKENVAINYLISRQISDTVLEKFSIGFAKNTWDGLFNFLKSNNIDQKLILKSCLAKQSSSNKIYDTFRGRIIFPVYVDSKRIAGFGGRIVPEFDKDSKSPKYLNSPETLVYLKSKILYGMPQALNQIKKTSKCYIVEGYLDVLSLHQVGIENVVAVCGTALTKDHLKRLSLICKKLIFLYDGDLAGQKAATKTFEMLLNSKLDGEIIFLPEGEDPDSVSKSEKENTSKFLSNLKKIVPIQAYIENFFKENDVNKLADLGPAARNILFNDLSSKLSIIKSNVELNYYLKFLSSKYFINLNLKQNEVKDSKVQSIRVESFSQFEQEVLEVCMVLKGEVIDKILSNTDIIQGLSTKSINFISELSKIFSEKIADTDKKLLIKDILKNDPNLLSLWKTAYDKKNSGEIDFKVLYVQLEKSSHQNKIKNIIRLLDKQISSLTDISQVESLLTKKIEYIKQLNQGQKK